MTLSTQQNLPDLIGVDEFLVRNVGRELMHYHLRLARDGYSNTFALGLIVDVDDLVATGVPEGDALKINQALHTVRALVARWTPLLRHIPVTSSVRTWLTRLPVNLSQHAGTLMELGFDTLGALCHICDEDTDDTNMRPGHVKVLVHCARSIEISQDPPEPIGLTVEEWLAKFNPPLDHYSRAVLLNPHVKSVLDLLMLTWSDVSQLVMRRGHQRLLWHYIVTCRVRWVTMV